MPRRFAITALATALLAAAPAPESAMHHATGTFEVTISPEAQAPAPQDRLSTARRGIAKTFSGGMTGEAIGTMLSAGQPRPGSAAAYVAIDQFHGTVEGHAGSFVLLHRGTMDKAGTPDLSVIIAPDTGTGALAGIAGTLSIEVKDGVHHYDLAYTLPR